MQRRKKTEKNEREKLFSVTRGSVLKKSLTGPTLLEMSGNREGWRQRRLGANSRDSQEDERRKIDLTHTGLLMEGTWQG